MSINKDKLLYRPCIGIALFNNAGHVFVGERIDTPGAWQMPQGGMDKGESIEEAALRELCEEIGTDKAEIIRIADKKICYELPDHLIGKLWNGKYRGQEQIWVAARFTGIDSDINLNAPNTTNTPPEFSAWQWVALDKTLDLIVPFKRNVYREVIDLFNNLSF